MGASIHTARLVALRVLQPEQLRCEADVFRCAPLGAVIPARTCIARRRATDQDDRPPSEATVNPAYASCRRCELGARVEAAVITVHTETVCAVPACGVVVRGARGRAPLCSRHRRNGMLLALRATPSSVGSR